MDKSKLEANMTTPTRQKLYQCYTDSMQDFFEMDLCGTGFAELEEILSRVVSLNEKPEDVVDPGNFLQKSFNVKACLYLMGRFE